MESFQVQKRKQSLKSAGSKQTPLTLSHHCPRSQMICWGPVLGTWGGHILRGCVLRVPSLRRKPPEATDVDQPRQDRGQRPEPGPGSQHLLPLFTLPSTHHPDVLPALAPTERCPELPVLPRQDSAHVKAAPELTLWRPGQPRDLSLGTSTHMPKKGLN